MRCNTPKDLILPVLPDNTEGNLLFNLNPMYNKTYYEYRIVKVTQEIFEGY